MATARCVGNGVKTMSTNSTWGRVVRFMSYERASSTRRQGARNPRRTRACACRGARIDVHERRRARGTTGGGIPAPRPGREIGKNPRSRLTSHPPRQQKFYRKVLFNTPSPNRPSAVYSHRYRVLTHSSITHVVFAVPAAGPRRRSPRQQMTALERCKLISNEARLARPSRRCRCLSACVSEPQLHRADIEARS